MNISGRIRCCTNERNCCGMLHVYINIYYIIMCVERTIVFPEEKSILMVSFIDSLLHKKVN